jgi:TM2 domain-containing membrane protein YozV
MSTTPNKPVAGKKSPQGFVYLPLIAGWLVPGAGHFLLGKWIRGTLLAVSIVAMFALGLAMQGKLYTSAQDILGILGVAGDLGSGLLYWSAARRAWARSPSRPRCRLRHQVHRRRRPAKHHCRRGRAQPAHGEEVLMFHPSHFAAVLLFALFASTVFGITMRDTPKRMFRYGAYCFLALRGLGHRVELGDVPDRTVGFGVQSVV